MNRLLNRKTDPFNPSIDLDCFGRFHLDKFITQASVMLPIMVIKDFQSQRISGLRFSSEDPDELILSQLDDYVTDMRLQLHYREESCLLSYIKDHPFIPQHQMHITPHFLEHFDLR